MTWAQKQFAAETLEFVRVKDERKPTNERGESKKIGKFQSTEEMEEVQVQDLVDEHLVEYYDDPDELALYQEYQEMEKYGRFFYLFKSCVGPTTFQTVELVGPLIAMCVILRIVSLLKLPRLIVHFVSFVCGAAALFLFVKKNALYPLTLCSLSYPVLLVRNGKCGMVMACTSVTYLITWYGSHVVLHPLMS